jgi:PAS domain S-box-containing protein
VQELDVTLGFTANSELGYNGSMTTASWTRVLFEAIDDAVFVHDEAGNILDANPAACRRLGYTREELLKLNTRDIDAPEFAAGFQNRLQSQLATGGMRIEGVHRTKNGRRIHVDINTSAIQLDGKPAVLAVMRDITQRKETEEALGKQSELLQSILDNMSDAIVVADAREQIVLFNPMAEHVFGPGLLQGTFALYQADRTTPLQEFPVARCVRGESFDDVELFVRHEGSPTGLWISVAGRPLRVRGGARTKGGVLVCHDITAAKRHECRVQAQNEIARIIAAGQEFSASAREILRILCAALDFEAGLLWQADPAANALDCLESWHHPQLAAAAAFLAQSQHSTLDAQADLLGAVWCEGQARRAHASDAPWVGTPRWHAARQAGLQAVFAFPIHSGEKTIGVLEFWQQRVHDDEDAEIVTMLQTMANQVGQFLDRQRVEKELRDSQALYESLVDCLPQNIFRKDRGSRVTFGNKRYCESLKRPLTELLGKTDFDLFPKELASKYVGDDRHIIETGETLDTIEEHRLPDGHRLFVHVVKTPVYNAENEIIGVQGIFWDVTQDVLAHEAVARSEKSYRQLTEATMDGIVVIDHDGNIVLFNPAAERMFGWRADEVIGSPARMLVPEGFHDLHAEGVGRPQEFKGKRQDGSDFPVEIALSALSHSNDGANHDHSAPPILAAIRDLTERNKMRAVLVQNEKLASIGLLSAGVAHEINNPLAFVANNMVVLERDCKGLLTLLDHYEAAGEKLAALDPDWAGKTQALADEIELAYVRANMDRVISRTRDGIERVARIVHSLRGMARTEVPRRQDTRIPEVINSSLEILHGKFKRLGVIVHQDHDPNPVVPCVPTQISQVVLNLLVNAFQAVEARHRNVSGIGRIDVRTRRVGDDFLLEIQDNGVGIKPEHRARLFDPFFTTKDVGEGTGLGLSISHHIINAHGGRIEVESPNGEGTCFRVHLPLKESRTQP